MGLVLELFSDRHVELARRFNARLREGGGDPAFVLPEAVSRQQSLPEETPFLLRQWVLVDRDTERAAGSESIHEEIRGGVLLQEMDCWVGSARRRAANIQTPIAEGAFHAGGAHLGPVLLKRIATRAPLLYAVGMGTIEQPFAKLLKALGWHVALSGFYFRAGRGCRFLKELAPLRTAGAAGVAASVAAKSGLGGPLVRAAHAAFGWQARGMWNRHRVRTLRATRIREWGDWAAPIWNSTQSDISFAAIRDAGTLPFLYPLDAGPVEAIRLDDADGKPCGWAALLCTAMQGGNFGSLRVGTILDAMALPGAEAAAVRAATGVLLELGAELVISNHTHRTWLEALRENGFFPGPSNYVTAASPALARAWKAEDPSSQRVWITRGDGDGRIHL